MVIKNILLWQKQLVYQLLLLLECFLKVYLLFKNIIISIKFFSLGEIRDRGVIVPVKRTIYTPILNELKREGILWTEKIIKNN